MFLNSYQSHTHPLTLFEQREPNPVDIPFYGLFHRDPYNGLSQSPIKLGIIPYIQQLTSPRDPMTETQNGFMEPKYLAFRFGDEVHPNSSSSDEKVSQDPDRAGFWHGHCCLKKRAFCLFQTAR